MRNADIETLEKVAFALRTYCPLSEYDLYAEYLKLCDSFKAKNVKEKQNYQQRAEYHRKNTQEWRKVPENKEKQKAYQAKYWNKKRAEKEQAKKDRETGGE